MGALKVIYLLNLLQKTTQSKDDILVRLYTQALRDVPEFQRLQALLNDHVFYSEIGKSLYQKGQELLKIAREEPSLAADTFRIMRQISDRIGHEIMSCQRLIEFPGFFPEPLTVLEKEKIPEYLSFFEQIAAACTYLIALYAGEDGLKRLLWLDGGGLAERVRAVNQVFLPSLCQLRTTLRAWAITRRKLDGWNLLGGTFYAIRYLPLSDLESLTANPAFERLTPHLFFNPRAAGTELTDDPWCWGMGHVVSTRPDESLRLLRTKVAVRPAAPSPADMLIPPPDPLACLRKLTGGAPFCISSEDLVASLNDWQMGFDINFRRRNHRCLICDKHVPSGHLVCDSHFSMEGV